MFAIGGAGPLPPIDLASSTASFDTFLWLFVLFVAAKIGEEIARRLGQPAVVGELLGGVVVGPYALGWAQLTESSAVFSEIGVVILLFAVGLEVRIDDLLAVGRSAAVTAVVGMLLPIAGGYALAIAIGQPSDSALYIGLAMAATSIGITSRVLADLGVLDRRFARVILGAAVIDDILVLVAIGIVEGATTGNTSTSAIGLVISAVGLLGLGFLAARRARGLPREVFTWPRFADTPLVLVFIFMFGMALVATYIGLAGIIGSFVAGLIVAETQAREEIEHEIRPLSLIFTPFFFAYTGAQLDLRTLTDPTVLALVVALIVVGVIAKTAGGLVGGWSSGRWAATTIGFGMVPRGEVGIVVANLGLAAGLLTPTAFSAVLVAVIGTTIVAPYLLAFAIPRATREEAAQSGDGSLPRSA